MLLLPPKPANYGKSKNVLVVVEWVMIPFVMIFLVPCQHFMLKCTGYSESIWGFG